MGFRRRRRLPPDVAGRLGLSAGDKVMAVAATASGGWLIASRTAIICHDGDAAVARQWTQVVGVSADRSGRLTVRWAEGSAPSAFDLDSGAHRLAAVINERVTASIVASGKLAVGPVTVLVAIRRAADGELFSQVVADGPLDWSDPAPRCAIEALAADLAEAAGLPRQPSRPNWPPPQLIR